MKEIEQILKTIPNLDDGEKAVVATVIDVQGSAYRGAGAKMLIRANGDAVGTVSGGCLEADVLERAKQVADSGTAHVFVYDTTKHEDSVFSLNMGCRGVIRILFEPFERDFFDRLRSSHDRRERFVSSVAIGGDIGGKREYAAEVPVPRSGMIGDAFFELIEAPVSMTIFGAGTDAVPVYTIAKTLGWRVSIVDHRPAFATRERFPDADSIHVLAPGNYAGNLTLDSRSVAVVMTHNYEKDKLIQAFLLSTEAAYIGALGPRKRTEKLLAEIGETWPANLYGPIGLDIGSESPEEIALAIIAEIQSALKNRDGGFLRDCNAGIH